MFFMGRRPHGSAAQRASLLEGGDAARSHASAVTEGVLRAAEHKKESKTLVLTVGEGLAPSRRNLAVLRKKVQRIRLIGEFSDPFPGSVLPAAGRGEPLPYDADRAMRL